MWFFVIFWGSFGHFYALTEFSMHLCAYFKFELHAHAPVHINWWKNQICVLGCMLRSHARNGNEFQTPGHLPAKCWDAWFLNSSKSKTHMKIMKLGMDVMSWYYHVVVKKWPNRNRFWYKLLANRSFSQEGSWFWEGACRNDISCPPWVYLQRQHRTTLVPC